MRHSNAVRRFLALVTLTGLVVGTVGVGSPVVAREPAAASFGGEMVEPGEGLLTSSGTRGMVDPKKLPSRAGRTEERPDKPPLPWSTSAPAGPSVRQPASVLVAPAPVQSTSTTRPPAGQPGFDGFYYAPIGDTTWQPPDPWVAVGPDHVIQTVNKAVQILDRNGNFMLGASLEDFFNVSGRDGSGNARVIFDSLHQRWVMTEASWDCTAADGIGYIDFLVSSTADPTDPWRLDSLQINHFLPDSPALGTSSVNVAFTANYFKMGPNCFGAGFEYYGTDIMFADWADVIRPPGAPDTVFDEFFFAGSGVDGHLSFFGTRVAVQTPATSATVHAVVQYDDPADDPVHTKVPAYFAFAGSACAGTVNLTAAAELTASEVVSPFAEPPDPIQPGGVAIVTTLLDSRPTDAIWQANKLTWVSTSGCTPTGDVSTRDCVRVTQIDTSPAHMAVPPAPIQDFLIGRTNTYNYVGGIGQAIDGTLHVVWTRSSTTRYPSSYTGYQVRSDPDNSLSIPALLKAGVTPPFSGNNRWGGYVGVAQDPQVPNAVWQGNLYSGGGPNWKTYISQLQTGGSSYVAIPPVRVLDTRPAYQIGLSGAFQANTPRTFAVGGSFGIPSNAIAVTGNVTVVNQTAGGYVSVTPTVVANPMSSTVNFPIGDTRANNLTVALAPNGKLAAVYKAPAGKTTHLIVDVTGYFLPGNEDATYSTVTPVRVLDTRPGFAIGLSGRFVPSTPRKLQVAGTPGIPADATAITGNLTVVGQTAAGYLSITKSSVANPTTSNLNFPLGDTRANGVSVPLNVTGALWIVYKATGGSTHVVLDVTGYYRDTPAGLLFYPLSPGRVMDTRPGAILTGTEGAFFANNPRRVDPAGHWGAPLSAQAVIGNLTVVNQTAAGYVSATLVSEPNPTTSVLNFPLGDIRANGVTLPLNSVGRTWFVYKAPSGKSTHLILDLSGYFN